MAGLPRESLAFGPLRPSEIKYAIYGRSGRPGLRFDRVLLAGWAMQPSIGLAARDINRLGLDIRSFRKPLQTAVRRVMMPSIRKNFYAGGRPDPWEPLADYTVKVRGSSRPILIRSGRLMTAASSFGIWTFSQTTAAIKELPRKAWYGYLHQAGYGSLGDIARRELGPRASAEAIEERVSALFHGERPPSMQTKLVIPQREFVLFQDEDQEAIQEVFIEWMEARAESVGRGWNIP